MNEKKRAALGYALVATAASSWGSWPYFLRKAESFGPLDSALESVVALGVITIVSGLVMMRDRVSVRASGRAWAGIVWLGIGDALNDFFFFRAYQTTSVAVAVLTHYLTPIFVAVSAPIVLHEKSERRTRIAVAVSFAGLVFLLEPWRTHVDRALWLGASFGAASAVFYASNVLVNKSLVPVFSGSEMMFWHGVVAVPLLLGMTPHRAWASLCSHALAWLVAGSIGPGALAGLFFVWGLRFIPASRASTLTLLEPLVATVVVGGIVFHEHIDALAMIGGVAILGGAAMALSNRAGAS
ncbi:MAG: DMT family transporter [Polyangiaceae bacterium]